MEELCFIDEILNYFPKYTQEILLLYHNSHFRDISIDYVFYKKQILNFDVQSDLKLKKLYEKELKDLENEIMSYITTLTN